MRKVLASVVIAAAAFGVGFVVHQPPAPTCIVVNSDGNPAPASCSNPNSYQVTP
jgi:hypothetical protein